MMAVKKFSQNNFKTIPTCPGCEAQCKITFRSAFYGYYPVIGNEVIEKYLPAQGVLEPEDALCQTPTKAMSLAAKVVKLCDYYKCR